MYTQLSNTLNTAIIYSVFMTGNRSASLNYISFCDTSIFHFS